MPRGENYLVISDLQIPFEHQRSLAFCKYLKRHYKITDDCVYNVGDETDQYFGGLWKKNPEARHTPNSELDDCKKRLRQWYKAFPEMKLCISNHGTRYWRKALDAEIPSIMLRKYEEIIEAPTAWKWKKYWKIRASKSPFMIEHGDDYGGQRAHIDATLHNGMSTIIGHHHTLAGTRQVKTANQQIWAAAAGSLIDFDAYAFDYARKSKLKPAIGAIVVLDGGLCPLWVPIESF